MFEKFDLLWPDVLVTIKSFLLAVAMTLVAGVLLGIVIVDSKILGPMIYPIVVGSQVVPKIAIAPALLVWFGFGIFSTSLIGALIAFFPAVLATVAGLRSVQPEKLDLARPMGAGRMRTLVRIRFPSALPLVLPGARLTTILALLGVLAGEFIGGADGIGKRTVEASAAYNTEVLFAASAYAVLLGLLAFGLVVIMEARVLRWHHARAGGFSL